MHWKEPWQNWWLNPRRPEKARRPKVQGSLPSSELTPARIVYGTPMMGRTKHSGLISDLYLKADAIDE